MSLPQKKGYTVADIYNLPDGERAELIDGQIYDMTPPPMRVHQKIVIELVKGIAIVLAAYVLMATVNPAYTGLKYAIANIFFN